VILYRVVYTWLNFIISLLSVFCHLKIRSIEPLPFPEFFWGREKGIFLAVSWLVKTENELS
jgi:hypothetical protein